MLSLQHRSRIFAPLHHQVKWTPLLLRSPPLPFLSPQFFCHACYSYFQRIQILAPLPSKQRKRDCHRTTCSSCFVVLQAEPLSPEQQLLSAARLLLHSRSLQQASPPSPSSSHSFPSPSSQQRRVL